MQSTRPRDPRRAHRPGARSPRCRPRTRRGSRPRTSAIGIVPVATTTHTEPFHVSKAIATLDYVSHGRAGLQARVSATALEARQFGRRAIADPTPTERRASRGSMSSATSSTRRPTSSRSSRRLWDSWEDDAEIRDVATGTVHRPRQGALHRLRGSMVLGEGTVDHAQAPQGQPLVSVLAHVPVGLPAGGPQRRPGLHHAEGRRLGPVDRRYGPRLTRRTSSRPADPAADLRRSGRLPGRRRRVGRTPKGPTRRAPTAGPAAPTPLVFVGTPADLADLMMEWQAAGIDGLPTAARRHPHDLEVITHELVGALQDRSRLPCTTTTTPPCGPDSGSPARPTATRSRESDR